MLDPLCICLLAAAVICVLSQTECGNNHTFNQEWGRNWCVKGCFYDGDSGCKKCSSCNPSFHLNPDGPVLQCQVDGSDHLCAPAEMTFASVLQDNKALPLLFLASFVISSIICGLRFWWTNKCYKRTYWLQKVKTTDRYKDGGNLNRTEVYQMYQSISDKVQKFSGSLKIHLRDSEQGGVEYSKDEICYRYLINLTDASNCDVTRIAEALCKLGFGELVYKIFNKTEIEDTARSDTPEDVMEREVVLDVCHRLYVDHDYLRHQFVIAIELGLNLTDIDTCRSQGILSEDAIQDIFLKWKNRHPSDCTFEYLRSVFKRAHVPQGLLNNTAAAHV